MLIKWRNKSPFQIPEVDLWGGHTLHMIKRDHGKV